MEANVANSSDSLYDSKSESYQSTYHLDFPGGTVGENPSANVGVTASIPGLGRFHMPQGKEAQKHEVLSPCDATTKVCVPRACAPKQEKLVPRNKEWPLLAATREHLSTATKTQCTPLPPKDPTCSPTS